MAKKIDRQAGTVRTAKGQKAGGPRAPQTRKKWTEPKVSTYNFGSPEERNAKRALYFNGPVAVLDPDTRCRAEICFALSSEGFFCEPMDNLNEVIDAKFRVGALILKDEGNSLKETIALMDDAGTVIPVIAFATSPSIDDVVNALRAGASSYFQWPAQGQKLVNICRNVIAEAEPFLEHQNRRIEARTRVRGLSLRETEVLHHIMYGASNREVGEHLSISPRTVEVHRANILQKLAANNTAEAIRIAFEASEGMRDLRTIE